MIIFGIIGLLVISYAVWVRKEQPRDEWFIFGGAMLLVYSISIHDPVFTILQVVFIISAVLELTKARKKRTKR